MLGPETKKHLSAVFEQSLKREIDADEAVWRSLPFFGAMLALAVTVLPSIRRAGANLLAVGARLPAYLLLAMSTASFARAAFEFWQVVRLRTYWYLPSDLEILDYATALDRSYQRGGIEDGRDERVRDELRRLMLVQAAEVTSHNRADNAAKAGARSHALLFTMVGFALAFLSEATILIIEAFYPTQLTVVSGGVRGDPTVSRQARVETGRRGRSNPVRDTDPAQNPDR